MEKRLTRAELIEILMRDRDHHFAHPHEVLMKFFYSIGGITTTLLVALFLENKGSLRLTNLSVEHKIAVIVLGGIIIIGYAVILKGLGEHTVLHSEQRKRLEKAIEYLVEVAPEAYHFDTFWEEFGKVKLKYTKNKRSNKLTGLIVAEPDTRGWWKYHDRKIELGIAIIVVGLIAIPLALLWL